MRALTRARPIPGVRRHVLSGDAVGGHVLALVHRPPDRSTNLLHHEVGDAADREAFLVAVLLAVAEEEKGAYAASRTAA